MNIGKFRQEGSVSSFASHKRSRSRMCAVLCLMAAFLFVGASSVALARLVKITVTGIVTSAVDETGVFGPAHGNLTGKKCTLVFTVDDMKGTKTIVTGNPAYASSIAATTGSNPSNPMWATLTIGSGTVYYGVKPTNAPPNSYVSRSTSGMSISTGGESYWVGNAVGEGSLEAVINFASPPYTANYNWESALDYTPAVNNTSGGTFVIAYGNSILGKWFQSADGYFKVTKITVIGLTSPQYLALVVTLPNGTTSIPMTQVKNTYQMAAFSSLLGQPIQLNERVAIAVPSGADPQGQADFWSDVYLDTLIPLVSSDNNPTLNAGFAAYWMPYGPHDYKNLQSLGIDRSAYDAYGNFEYGATGKAADFSFQYLQQSVDKIKGEPAGTNNSINVKDITSGYNAIANEGTLGTVSWTLPAQPINPQ